MALPHAAATTVSPQGGSNQMHAAPCDASPTATSEVPANTIFRVVSESSPHCRDCLWGGEFGGGQRVHGMKTLHLDVVGSRQ